MSTDTEHTSWDDLRAMLRALAQQSAETDRQIRELRLAGQETSAGMKDTDARMKETDALMKQTGRRLDQIGLQIAGLGDKFGYFTEGMALPSMERLLTERFGMENISPRHRVRRLGREQEYDVLAWANGDVNSVVLVEVKSRVRLDAIEQLLAQIETLPQMLPELAGKARLGILAGVDWQPEVEQAAQAAGLYTARIHDEMFELTTPSGFAPKRWA
ncbi:MAG: DUF3782 domain-containing protein [Clostridia bacterium]|nr:DUF3782 domain-containing protein [Clostridia bacterium]